MIGGKGLLAEHGTMGLRIKCNPNTCTIGKLHCMNCGKTGKLTKAHVLPRSWQPTHNLMIPLCQRCHILLDAGILCPCELCNKKRSHAK